MRFGIGAVSGLGRTCDAGEDPEFDDCSVVIPSSGNVIPFPQGNQMACPADAKQCPDGSFVGRNPVNCAFLPCPTSGIGPRTGTTPQPRQASMLGLDFSNPIVIGGMALLAIMILKRR